MAYLVRPLVKQLWLFTVAKAARSHRPGAPVFAMFEGAKLLTTVHSQDFVRWPTVRAIWKAVLEQLCLEESSDTVLTNMVFPKALPQLPDGSSTWTQEFKRAVLEAIDAWNWNPEGLQVEKWVKRLDADPKKFLGLFR